MVRASTESGVTTLLLCRPDKRNALIPDTFAALRDALKRVHTSDARALVLGGEGPVFCGGFDLKLCLAQPGTLEVLLRELAAVVQTLRTLPQPVVVAAQGAAIAGGCALLAAADIVVTDRAAKIGYPVVPLGVSPAVSAPTLRQAIGDGRARERLLDPALISGEEAARIGLAHVLVEQQDEVLPRAQNIAQELASKPPGAMAATKTWINEIAEALSIGGASDRGLAASLSLVGNDEERDRLTKLFARA
jgi:enoyl-CoA hydratase/carnithine racemase